MDKAVIDDFVLLGRAVPEQLRDGRITCCAAGYSHEHGFVRIYPTRPRFAWRRWDIVKASVRRNPQDGRAESWRLDSTKWDEIATCMKVTGRLPKAERRRLLERHLASCAADLNEEHQSLGIVKPVRSSLQPRWTDNPLYGKAFQQALAGFAPDPVDLKRDYLYEPRVQYRCPRCQTKRPHDMQILAWEFYQWQRKNPGHLDQVWGNAMFDSDTHDLYFLLGNQQNRLNSYMVISVLREPKTPGQQRLL